MIVNQIHTYISLKHSQPPFNLELTLLFSLFQEYHWVHIVTEAAATAGMKQKIDEATQVIGWVPTPLNYQGTGFG